MPLLFQRFDYLGEHANIMRAAYLLRMNVINSSALARGLNIKVRLNDTNLPFYIFNEALSLTSINSNYYNTLKQNLEKNGVMVDPTVNYSNVLPTGEVRSSTTSLSSAILQYLTACANLQIPPPRISTSL